MKKNQTRMIKLVLVSLMGSFCFVMTGCGDGGGQPPVIIQQPAPVAPVAPVYPTPLPPVVQVPPSVPPTVPTTVITAYPTPYPTPVPVPVPGVITIQLPGQLASPPPPAPPVYPPVYTPYPTPYPPVVQQPPPNCPQPPYDPNCPPWWAGRRGRTITIVKIKPGEIDIIQKSRSRWDPWNRGPAGWWNPQDPNAVQPQPAAPATLAAAPVTQ